MSEGLQLSRKDAVAVKVLLEAFKPCILCGEPAAYSGVFVPERPELWGGQPGKRRLYVYGLCARCMALPDNVLHVEARIHAGLVGRGN